MAIQTYYTSQKVNNVTVQNQVDPVWGFGGWTNQGTVSAVSGETGPDTLIGLPGAQSPQYASFLPGAGLQGAYAATMDVALGSMGTLVTNVGYFALINVPAEVTSANCAIDGRAAGTTTHGYVFLCDVFGNVLATTSDKTSNLIGTTTGVTAWASAVTVGPGLYYMGIAVTTSATPTYGGAGSAVGQQNGLTYSASSPYVFPRFVTATGLTLTSAPTSFTFVTASSATVGVPYMALLP